MRIREPWPRARTRQRRREFAALFERVPQASLGAALEIGAGDGFLASMLAPYCRSLVATDSYRPRLTEGEGVVALRRLICDATALPFASHSFDFIFSSSVLEHVRDRPAALAEMDRCLRPGGVMLHIMPSRTWKLLQLLFYYPHLVVGGVDLMLEKLTAPRPALLPPSPDPSPGPSTGPSTGGQAQPVSAVSIADRWSDRRSWRPSLRTILHGALPRVHGEFADHLREWRGFGARSWIDEFQSAGFEIHRILLLPLYSGYGFGFERLRRFGERARLSSHNAFLLTRAGLTEAPPALAWFRDAPAPALALEPGTSTDG